MQPPKKSKDFEYPYPDYQLVPTKSFTYTISDETPTKVSNQLEWMKLFLKTIEKSTPKTMFTSSNLFHETITPDMICGHNKPYIFSSLELKFIQKLKDMTLSQQMLKFCLDPEDWSPNHHACFYRLLQLFKAYTNTYSDLKTPELAFLYRPRYFDKSMLKQPIHVMPRLVFITDNQTQSIKNGKSEENIQKLKRLSKVIIL